MLRVIEGEGRRDDRVSLTDIPLGPWAGASLEFWASKTGAVWHGDPGCTQLRGQARREVHVQPSSGHLDSIMVPDQFHCRPPGQLGAYWNVAETLIRFDSATHNAAAKLRRGDLDLAIFEPLPVIHRPTGGGAVTDDPGQSELADLWERCVHRRRVAVEEAQRELARRLPIMLAAAWVATGKTARQHQDRYARFLDVAERECEARGITFELGIRYFTNDRILPFWLEAVAAGRSPDNITNLKASEQVLATRSWSGQESEEFLAAVHNAWTATGAVWEHMLRGIALSHEGDVLALFHKYDLKLTWELEHAFYHVLPHAEISTSEFSWVVARVPAVLSLFLKERERGLVGLVLTERYLHVFDTQKCALFLRNLLVDLNCAELASHVREIMPNLSTQANEIDDDHEMPARQLHWQLQVFASGFRDHGLTRERCLPALRAAWDDQQLGSLL